MPFERSISLKKSPSPKLYFLHGFLGEPEDWEGVMQLLPEYTCIALSYPFQLPYEGILIGYSMGGRIALKSPLLKIILSAHPGLTSKVEKAARWKQDQKWIEKLKTQPLSTFLQEWYQQPLFQSLRAHPIFKQVIQRRLNQDPNILIEQLAKNSLAHQNFNLPSQTFFIHGALDTKYKDLYLNLKIPSIEITGAGHACHLERPAPVAESIRSLIKKCFNPN